MADVNERFEHLEGRIDSVEHSIYGLHGEVGELHGEVGELRGEVGGLRGEVHELRLITETHGAAIASIGEVLGEHGRQLEQISKALEPLHEIKAFVDLIADNHERRITALERCGGRPE